MGKRYYQPEIETALFDFSAKIRRKKVGNDFTPIFIFSCHRLDFGHTSSLPPHKNRLQKCSISPEKQQNTQK